MTSFSYKRANLLFSLGHVPRTRSSAVLNGCSQLVTYASEQSKVEHEVYALKLSRRIWNVQESSWFGEPVQCLKIQHTPFVYLLIHSFS